MRSLRPLAGALILVVLPALARADISQTEAGKDPVPAHITAWADHWSKAVPKGMSPAFAAAPQRIVAKFRDRVMELDPGATVYVTEGNSVVSALGTKNGERFEVQLIVSDPDWGSSPMVTMQVHQAVPGGMGRIEDEAFRPYSYQVKRGGKKEWKLVGGGLSEGRWTYRGWVGSRQNWYPSTSGRFLVNESVEEGGNGQGPSRITARYLTGPKGRVDLSEKDYDTVEAATRGYYPMKEHRSAYYSDLKKSGVYRIIHASGKVTIRRTPGKPNTQNLTDHEVVFVSKSKDGRPAHLRLHPGRYKF